MIDWKGWGAFLFLGILAWGMSFMWIKIALEELGPFMMVCYRMAFALATVWLLIKVRRVRISADRREVFMLLALGLFNTAIPITMISWAEKHISSGMAGMLNGTVPLWTILGAHWLLHDDRITAPKAAGLAAGFAGLVLLVGGDPSGAHLHDSIVGQIAVVIAAMLYASSNVFVRRYLKGRQPLQTAGISLISSLVFMLVVTPFVEPFPVVPRLPLTWLACAWLGVVGLGFAYMAYFYLINHWGASRTSMVTNVSPAAAVVLGIIFLGEPLTWRLFVGGLLIIGGIALVNLVPSRAVKTPA